jgi:hypothetical protein
MEDDKVDRWLADHGSPVSPWMYVLRLGVFVLSFVAMIPFRTPIRDLEYRERNTVLSVIATALLFFPVAFPALPRSLLPVVYAVCAFGLTLGVAYCGDMGDDGHMFTAVYVILASIVAAVLAWPLVGRK